ncbi:hypothetical protein [Pseudoduganella violaceinigra]|uniref:hypothetical protein n=1 Tax=Pseudoduganella violaceinigra TaxID=246602 RepID=UPI00040582EE|nr:hypothetical protein [Pseudoduganella violaceinigra]
MPTPPHTWQFAKSFRRNAFGWNSDKPITRLKEALAEIKQMARAEPELAAEGGILLFEKLEPALSQVDSSSGGMGSAVSRAIDVLVPLIAKPKVSKQTRQRWLECLWKTLDEAGMGYLDRLADHWGELCASPDMASQWADKFLPGLKENWTAPKETYSYYKGCTPCLSCLYAAKRYDELLELLEMSSLKWWYDRRWGAKAWLAKGEPAKAIEYAEATKTDSLDASAIPAFCETILLDSGHVEEAYARYAMAAASGTTNLAIFRSIRKKYPAMDSERILRDLAASKPGQEGKWFAAAKYAGLYDLAIELVQQSPTDPRTLIRAGEDFAQRQPEFALAASLAAISYIAQGYGYEITGAEVFSAWLAAANACKATGMSSEEVKFRLTAALPENPRNSAYIESTLAVVLRG